LVPSHFWSVVVFWPFPFALANTKRQLLNLHMIVYCLNQVLSAIPLFQLSFLGIPMVSMLLYVWSREYPNSQINMYGLVQLRVCNITVLFSPLPIFMLHNQCSNPCRPGNICLSRWWYSLPCSLFIFHGLCSDWMWYLAHHYCLAFWVS
jgi:hypothetical protein